MVNKHAINSIISHLVTNRFRFNRRFVLNYFKKDGFKVVVCTVKYNSDYKYWI